VPLRDHFEQLLFAEGRVQAEKWAGHEQAHELIALALKTQAEANDERLDRMNEFREQLSQQASTFLTVDRFEREHKVLLDRTEVAAKALNEKIETAITNLGEKVGVEHGVTIRQDTTQTVLDKITDINQTNRRWQIGLVIGVILSLFGSIAAIVVVLQQH